MRDRPRDAGFSILEVLIAAALFLFITLSISGLYARSAVNNFKGADSTRLANLGKTAVEELLYAPFDSTSLTVPAGATEASVTQYWSESANGFVSTVPPAGTHPKFRRVLTVRYCGIGDLDDNGRCDTPLQGDSDPGLVHLKEIRVELRSSPGGMLGGQRMQLVTFKPF
ncbi:MAG TPA: hypothetical protein VF017_02330 [Thermoanaerobaculia bacterium]|nr:hypothetical protein [Thermoanaerobaculia bacterium]